MIGTNATFDIHGATRQNGVTRAIQQASARTGVDFGYLVQQAKVESSLNPQAKARTSSATGLYQFIEQTWLRMVKNYGDQHGYGKYANAIRQDSSGRFTVPNAGMRKAVLNLRTDPKAASLMAAELASENNAHLRNNVGIQPNATDLYMAHFLGAGGASSFLKSMQKNPWAPAASLFPEAARANRAVFYENGKPLSLQAVYNRFENKMAGAGAATPVQRDGVQQAAATRAPRVSEQARIELPLAQTWDNPLNSVAARRVENLARLGQNVAVAAERTTGSAGSDLFTGFGASLRSPVDVMFLTQDSMRFEHNNRRRYNA